MNLIDGFVRVRPIVPDAAGSSKCAGANGVASPVGRDASFGDVLSQVAKGDGAAGQSAPNELASFRETASGRLESVATGESGLRSFNEGGARHRCECGAVRGERRRGTPPCRGPGERRRSVRGRSRRRRDAVASAASE